MDTDRRPLHARGPVSGCGPRVGATRPFRIPVAAREGKRRGLDNSEVATVGRAEVPTGQPDLASTARVGNWTGVDEAERELTRESRSGGSRWRGEGPDHDLAGGSPRRRGVGARSTRGHAIGLRQVRGVSGTPRRSRAVPLPARWSVWSWVFATRWVPGGDDPLGVSPGLAASLRVLPPGWRGGSAPCWRVMSDCRMRADSAEVGLRSAV
jgi:hypothetical protein